MNRIQHIAVYDLIKRIRRLNQMKFILANQLIDQAESFDNLMANKVWIGNKATINQSLMTKSIFVNTVSNGLISCDTTISRCNDDISNGVFIRDATLPANLGQQQSLGYTIKGYPDNMTVQPPAISQALHIVTICHDLLDAMMYEVQGLHSGTGEFHKMSFMETKNLTEMRLRSLNRHLAVKSGYIIDYAVIEGLRDIVTDSLKLAKDMVDLSLLASEIESGIPRLILFRRHWAL